MAKTKGVQGFLEEKAEGPAFALVALCMMLRAVSFYSGNAHLLINLLGVRGLAIFDDASGFGLTVGTELLMSIAGRQWQSNKREAREASARRGLNRNERAALVAHYTSKARLSLLFMLIGLGASVTAAFSFLWSATGVNSIGGALSEILVSLLLVSVVFYLGVVKESKGLDPSEVASAQAHSIRGNVVDAAGRRIAAGAFTPQDVRIVAQQLERNERDRFLGALLPETPDDPVWTAADIARWLGAESATARKQIARKLRKLADSGAGAVMDDTTGKYRIPRSVVVSHFAGDYVEMHARGATARNPTSAINETAIGQTDAAKPQKRRGASDRDKTQTAIRQPSDSGASPHQGVIGALGGLARGAAGALGAPGRSAGGIGPHGLAPTSAPNRE